MVESGESFYRYSDAKIGAGGFLTQEAFLSADDAAEALFTKTFNNFATRRQAVLATKSSLVLEGGIRDGRVGIAQTLILDRNAFVFGIGRRY